MGRAAREEGVRRVLHKMGRELIFTSVVGIKRAGRCGGDYMDHVMGRWRRRDESVCRTDF